MAEERLRISSRKKKDKKIEFLEKRTISEMTEWEKQQIRYNKRKKNVNWNTWQQKIIKINIKQKESVSCGPTLRGLMYV